MLLTSISHQTIIIAADQGSNLKAKQVQNKVSNKNSANQ